MPASSVRIISSKTHAENNKTQDARSIKEVWRQVLPFALVYLLASVLLFANLGKYPLFNPDEALYAEPAREMLEIGDYITTYLNYVVRFTKPPLVIWAQAASILAFGCNEFAVRFFQSACGAVLVACTYIFTEKFAGRRAAIASSITLATCPLYVGTAREAITDMPLAFFSASSMFLFYFAFKTRRIAVLALAYICTGLAVMTKGPVGLVLPLVILGSFHFLKGNLKEAFKAYKPLMGMAIVGLIALPWFIVEIYITKGAYFNDFIVRENFQRYTSVVDSHKGGWWYHIAAMLGGSFPWAVFAPQAIFASSLPSKLKEFWTNSGPFSILHAYRNNSEEEDLGLFCLCWTVLTVGFFSVSVSKLLPYTLPAFPALAILIALEFERIINSRSVKRALIPVLALFTIFAGSTLVLPMALSKLRDAPENLVELAQSFASYELIFTVAAASLICRKFFRSAYMLFLIPTVAGMLFFGSRTLGVLSKTWEEPLPDMARYAAGCQLPLLVYDMRKPSMPFYAHKQVIQPGSEDELKSFLKGSKGAYILSKTKRNQFFRDLPGCKIHYSKGKFVLVRYFAEPEATVSK